MPAFRLSNPDGVHRGVTSYSLAAEVEAGARRLVISGQVGTAPDGTVPADAPGQIECAFANIATILKAHGMGMANIVKMTVFLTDRSHLGALREARKRVMGDHASTSTLLFVSGLADPAYVVEIEAEAVA